MRVKAREHSIDVFLLMKSDAFIIVVQHLNAKQVYHWAFIDDVPILPKLGDELVVV